LAKTKANHFRKSIFRSGKMKCGKTHFKML